MAQTTYEGTQLYKDGKFYKVIIELQSNGTLLFKGEKNVSWTMTKKTQTSAQATSNTSTTTSQNIETLRSAAQNNVVAQALNYVSGLGEDAKGDDFYYPLERDNGKCIFKFTRGNIIDLNKGDPNSVEIYNKSTSDAYGTYYPYIQSNVVGLDSSITCGSTRQKSCSSQRVQRAWALIYKECKGTRKAF